jgi:flavin-dependent dehydrogenase
VLDALLLESAAAAGAEVRPRFTVTDLVWDGDRVTGVVGHGPGGRSVVDSARIVIGADGRNSFVAETVRARRYEEHAGASCCYYAHWAGLAAAEPELHFTSCLAVGVHPTHDDLTCVTVTRPVRHWTRFKRAPEATYRAELQRIPALAERFGSARREGRFIGSADLGSCFRQAAGQGWVLVGDAGHYRDPLLGGGIADALVQAGLVSRVVANGLSGDDSLEEAVGAFGKLRDGAWRPLDNATRSVASFAWTQAELPDLLRREAEASAVILALVDQRGALG